MATCLELDDFLSGHHRTYRKGLRRSTGDGPKVVNIINDGSNPKGSHILLMFFSDVPKVVRSWLCPAPSSSAAYKNNQLLHELICKPPFQL